MTARLQSLRCGCGSATPLVSRELEAGLPAQGCDDCGGSVLQLGEYQAWRDRSGAQVTPHDPVVFEDTPGARPCPNCQRLMHRLRAGLQPDFRLDRCAACQLVWFDQGEWQALVAAGHAARLDEILGDAWQRHMQATELRSLREASLRARHGDACIDELGRMREWLEAQENPDELINLLRTGW
jgi:Zn-finger nucleic acid-binding protein